MGWHQVKLLLRVGSVFMVGETLFHISGLRLWGVEQVWPVAAISYATFFHWLWASASAFIAGLLWILSKKPQSFAPIISFLGWFCLVHACLLIAFAWIDLPSIWQTPSLFIWNPYYSFQLVIEGLTLASAGFVFIKVTKTN